MTSFTFQSTESTSRRVSELEEKIERYSRVPHYVLITGERGTGKTTIAKRLHRQSESDRKQKPFVNLNCASLTQELLESELFGYEKGAFTGAFASKAGLFEIANGGTLFLDEIGEIPLGLQAKLLKAVEEKRIRRVGSNAERPVETRIIAATSQNLEQMIAGGRFRADLYDRLNILRLETVPLKFQKEKILNLLTERLTEECRTIGRRKPFEFSDNALRLLLSYEWNGNFRELHNFATRIAVECVEEEIISTEAVRQVLGLDLAGREATTPNAIEVLAETVAKYNFQRDDENLFTLTIDPRTDDLESIYMKAVGIFLNHRLGENKGKIRRTAKSLGLAHSTVTRLMTKINANSQAQEFAALKSTRKKYAAPL